MFQLFYYPDNASLAPHLLLAETQLEYTLRLVDRTSDAHKTDDYLQLNPAGRIPTLVHNDLVLFESPAICIYICEQAPEAQLMPPLGHPDRPLFFQWLTYLNNTLQAEFMVWRYPDRHTTHPDGIEGIRAAQDARLVEILALLDDALSKHRFLAGETVSACDFFLFMLMLWCGKLSRPLTSFPNLWRLIQEIANREAVQRVCKIENIDITHFKE